MMDSQPWNNEPAFFTSCKISVNAVIKMLVHACLGSMNICNQIRKQRGDGHASRKSE